MSTASRAPIHQVRFDGLASSLGWDGFQNCALDTGGTGTASASIEVFDSYRVNGVSRVEAENLAIKVQFSVQRTLYVLSLAKAMLFTFKGDVGDRNSFLVERSNHCFGLVGWHDFVFQALQKYSGAFEAGDVMDG